MHVYKLVSILGKLSKELDTVFLPSFGCNKDDNLLAFRLTPCNGRFKIFKRRFLISQKCSSELVEDKKKVTITFNQHS